MDRVSSENIIVSSPADQKVIEQGHQLGDWFIFRDERHFGPLSSKQVSRALLKRYVSIEHFIWRPGFHDWVPIKDVECFRACGTDTIKNMTDDDFSRLSRLGSVDKVNFSTDGTDLSFTEQLHNNVDIILDDMVSQRFLKRISKALPEKYREKLDKTIDDIGLSRSEWMFKRASIILFAVTVLFGMVLILSTARDKSFIETLPKDTQTQLYNVSAIPLDITEPAFTMMLRDQNAKDPTLVGATNLPIGSDISIEIMGDPQSLLGAHRFAKTYQFKLSSKIFQSDPIREVTGQFVPPGYYDVFVSCKACGANQENLELFRQRYLFGVQDLRVYRTDLLNFHQQTRKSARLELDELIDIQSSLRDQYQTSVDTFVKFSSAKDVVGWNKASADWLPVQKKLIELFEQMKSREFTEKIYYLEIYERMRKLSQQIFELHMMQDKIINEPSSVQSLVNLTSETSSQVNLSLLFEKSQLDLMNANYSKSKGLPSKAGLKVNDL